MLQFCQEYNLFEDNPRQIYTNYDQFPMEILYTTNNKMTYWKLNMPAKENLLTKDAKRWFQADIQILFATNKDNILAIYKKCRQEQLEIPNNEKILLTRPNTG